MFTLKFLPSSTPFPIGLRNLNSPQKYFNFQVKYTRNERVIIRKREEFEKFYTRHRNKPSQELKPLIEDWIKKERKKGKKDVNAPIEFKDILGQGMYRLTCWALCVAGITKEEKPEEEKPEEGKPKEKKPEDKDDAEFKKWMKEGLKEEKKEEEKRKKEEEKRKKEDLALALQKSMSGKKSGEATGAGNLLGVQAFKSFVLALLLGADPNDPAVKALLPSLPDESKVRMRRSEGGGESQ